MYATSLSLMGYLQPIQLLSFLISSSFICLGAISRIEQSVSPHQE